MMGFISIYFLIFLAVLFPVYFLSPKKYRWIALLVASLVFLALCSWKAIFFILFATLATYLVSFGIKKIQSNEQNFLDLHPNLTEEEVTKIQTRNKKKQKAFLVLGIVSLLSVLAVMKYLDFIIGNINAIIGWFDTSREFSLVNLILPLGISFYTFQAIGYLADIYWKRYDPEKNFFKFLLFMSFFPKLMQGPIIRYNEISQSLFEGNDFDYRKFTDGLKRILWGFFKKLCIADCLFVFTTYAFGDPFMINGLEGILAVACYFIADYCDFSGYMDIACGTAMCFGVKMPENFNHPYFAKSIADYWRRWHITLGKWFRDYVFYPLSTSRCFLALGRKSKKILKKNSSKLPAIIGLIIVWFLTGLWHGASWKFVVWGLYFGVLIALGIIFEPLFNKMYKKLHINPKVWWLNTIRIIRTLLLVALGKILFETASFSDMALFLSRIFDLSQYYDITYYFDVYIISYLPGLPSFVVALILSVAVLVVDIIQELKPQTTMLEKLHKKPLWFQWLLFILLIVCVVWFGYYGGGLPRYEFGYVVF